MSKRYYWLKLQQNFFESREIKVLKGMENGSEYILFWLQVLLSSLEYSDDESNVGRLVFKENIPWSVDLMMSVFGFSKEITTGALAIFKKLGMITVTDSGEMWANDIQKLIGTETTEAKRKREYRAKLSARDNVPELSQSCPIEKEKEIELEKKKDKEIKKEKKYAPCIYMKEEAYKKLCDQFGKATIHGYIEKISDYQLSRGRRYKDIPATIRAWMRKDSGVSNIKTLEKPKVIRCQKCGHDLHNEIANGVDYCYSCMEPMSKEMILKGDEHASNKNKQKRHSMEEGTSETSI